jgi:plastocyanin
MRNLFLPLILIGTVSLILGCKKSDTVTLPSLSTTPVANITSTTATSGGNISSDGNTAVTTRGICWSPSSDPTISDSKTSDGSGTGEFASNITGITSGTLYYVRSYATNSAGTAYGDQVSFTATAPQLAALSTTSVTLITTTTAMSGGIITGDGGSVITGRGVCWSTNISPTISGSHTSDGAGSGSFDSNLTGLSSSTIFHVRAYATNNDGTAYGNEVIFTTNALLAVNEVSIQGMAFNPLTLTVTKKTTVKWTNNDSLSHTVTSDTGAFNSGTINPAGTFSFQFTSTGTFNYHCAFHPDMTATIIVQ